MLPTFRALVLAFCSLFWAVACEVFPFSPHEVRLDESQRDLTRKSLERIDALPPRESFKIAVLGDIQDWLTETRDAIPVLNRLDDIEFVVQVGDLTQFGLAKEFRWSQQILSSLDPPLLLVIGNHDLLSNGKAIFTAMYGPSDFAFSFGGTKFVFIDNNSREYDFDGTTPDLRWLKSQLTQDGTYDRAVVVSHVPPRDPDFDPDLSERFAAILRDGGVVLSLHGHAHAFTDREIFEDGVRYLAADAMRNRNFLVVSMGPGTLGVERVFY